MKLVWHETIKAMVIILSLIIISTLIINLLYYFDIINNNVTKYLKMFFLVISFLIGGIYMGKHSPNKGYFYGLRLSFITIIIFVIFGIIFNNLSITRIIYYLITTFCITFGAMIGINKKNN